MHKNQLATSGPCSSMSSDQRNGLVLISGIGELEHDIRKWVRPEGWSICNVDNADYLAILEASLKPALIVTHHGSKLLEQLQASHGKYFYQSTFSSLSDIIKVNIDKGFGLIYARTSNPKYTLYRIEDTHQPRLKLCENRQALVKGDTCIKLTYAEFSIMQLLAETRDKTVTKDQLSESALRRIALPNDRSIDVHISRIRKKTIAALGENMIKSVRGVGYKLVVPIT